MALTATDLENLADHLLQSDMKQNKRNKSRTEEFSILSPSQNKRRSLTEIPYSNLTEKQKMECRAKNLDYAKDREGD